ncbi:FxDxF family PEP-CTERM protein [Rhodoferax sp. TBRC 17198]|uniref:beta strand repeat-containing protein n=1 Tax=Rhodoferax potami TaxID=3068338 RepID=UPI0028BE4007|nr:FxDxF family PEP-CTERM protein [Rhodoferax sp. TBRC 17198]MDT7521878.1 FxDxF family PEP-CTERM protein [Rhodoferax sp. TBRC 17198]
MSGITFASGAGAYNIGGNTITSTGDIINNSSRVQKLYAPTIVNANQTWDGGAEGLNVYGAITLRGYGLTLTNKTNLNNTAFNVNIGSSNAASLIVQNASVVNTASAFLGTNTGGVGNVTVTGAGSQWKSSSNLIVGNNAKGIGTLNVENAAVVNSAQGYVGHSGGSTGSAKVTGAGSQWKTTSTLYVGNSGNGTLDVENGGVVNSLIGAIGFSTGGVGTATVTGAGSQWNNSTTISVGSSGTGTLNISNSGTVTTSELSVGNKGRVNLDGGTLQTSSAILKTGSVFNWLKGTLNLTGAGGASVGTGLLGSTTTLDSGQTLNVTNTLTVGSGKELVLNGGQVNANATTLTNGIIRSTGTIDVSRTGNITGSGSLDGAVTGGAGKTITASGGNLNLGNVASTNGYAFAGNLVVGSRQVDLLSANQAQLGTDTFLSRSGKLKAVNGINLGAGNTLTYLGDSTVEGNFTNNGSVGGNEGTLNFLNDVNGAGSYAGNVAFKAAFNPGSSLAAVSFNGGNVSFESGSVLNMEIFGSTPGAQYDQLVNINTLTFNGTLNLVFSNGYVPLAGSSFALFGFNTFNGSLTQDNITVTGYDRSRLDFSQLATNGSVSVTAVPEPETYAMLLAGLGLMGAIVRRRRASLSA